MNFDLTPIVRTGSAKFIAKVVACMLPIILLAVVLGQQSLAVDLFRGTIIGLLDLVIIFTAIKKALPYVNEPERGVKIMKRYRYIRLFVVASFVILMLKMKYPLFNVFAGLLLVHIFYIINLLIITYRQNNRRREERSEKWEM